MFNPFLSGNSKLYGTCLGFWAIGCIPASTSNPTSIAFLVLGSLMFPIPWIISSYYLISSFVDFDSFISLIRLILSSFVSFKLPFGSISVSLPIRGRLSICPLSTMFRIIVSNSPFTDSSPCMVFSVMVGF